METIAFKETKEEKIEYLENIIKVLHNPAANMSYKRALLDASVGMLLSKWVSELKEGL